MKIAVDAMGGDYAPRVVVEGAIDAAKEGIAVILVGNKNEIEALLSKYSAGGLPITTRHASEVVSMEESPASAVRKKKDSSIRVCFELAKSGEAGAVVSAGNSGAVMAAGMLILKRLSGVDRPAITVRLPTLKGPVVFLDAGGNVDCKPIHLAQFAVMGGVYAKYVLKKDNPKVGLLSNGEEESKGNELVCSSNVLIKKTSLNYVGYVEGKDIYKGDVDVIVADGFVGNVVLKLSEGIIDALSKMLKEEIIKSHAAKIGYLLSSGAFKRLKKKIDYAEYGGAPLLGIDGIAIISHGASSRKAIKNAILRAGEFAREGVNEHLIEELEKNKDLGMVV